MTINKAEGQTLHLSISIFRNQHFHMDNYMLLFLEQKTTNSVKVLIRPTSCGDSNGGCNRNVVYQEVLKLAKLY